MVALAVINRHGSRPRHACLHGDAGCGQQTPWVEKVDGISSGAGDVDVEGDGFCAFAVVVVAQIVWAEEGGWGAV